MLRRLSPTAELILINLITFGPFAARSVLGLIARNTAIVFDDRRAHLLLGTELLCGALAWLLLRARGWTAASLGLRITMPHTIGGMLVLIGSNITITTFYLLVRSASGIDLAKVTSWEATVTWPVLIALTLINPFYDELFLVAYNLEAAKPHGAAFAVTLSAAIRFLCHLDQGPIAAVTILPLGLIFALVYWRWRAVWPLIVAHGVMDFVGMMPR